MIKILLIDRHYSEANINKFCTTSRQTVRQNILNSTEGLNTKFKLLFNEFLTDLDTYIPLRYSQRKTDEKKNLKFYNKRVTQAYETLGSLYEAYKTTNYPKLYEEYISYKKYYYRLVNSTQE